MKKSILKQAREVQQRTIDKHIDIYYKPETIPYKYYMQECTLYAIEKGNDWKLEKDLKDCFWNAYQINKKEGYL